MIDTSPPWRPIARRVATSIVLAVNPRWRPRTGPSLVGRSPRGDGKKLTYSSPASAANNPPGGRAGRRCRRHQAHACALQGTGPALADVIRGQSHLELYPRCRRRWVRSRPDNLGRCRGPARSASSRCPDVPTLKGTRDRRGGERWHAILRAGQGRPTPMLEKIEQQAKQAMRIPSGRRRCPRTVELPHERTRAQFAKFVADEACLGGTRAQGAEDRDGIDDGGATCARVTSA